MWKTRTHETLFYFFGSSLLLTFMPWKTVGTPQWMLSLKKQKVFQTIYTFNILGYWIYRLFKILFVFFQEQRHYFTNKGLSSQGYGFSCGHVWMWELGCEEGWVPKNWCFWTVVLEKTLESPLDCKEIQPVHSKGDQSWDFFGRHDAKAEIPVLWPPHVKSWLIGKDSAPGRD